MKALLCIDDTDNLESPGSGHLLEEIARTLESEGLCRSGRITRHQLFVHPDVPYTSHNSSMCINLSGIEEPHTLIRRGEELLSFMAAPGSDPGFCYAPREEIEAQKTKILLTGYGRQAKTEVLTKPLALDIAARCGIYLNELGGTGDGIIGAVAGIGLRLSGNDGRFRGKFDPEEYLRGGSPPHGSQKGESTGASGKRKAGAEGTMTVCRLLEHPLIDQIGDVGDFSESRQLQFLAPEERVFWTSPVKTVLLDHRAVLPVKREGGLWRALDKVEVKELFP